MAESVVVPKNPMVGSFGGCCARAASGHAAAPPSSEMNVRRLMCSSQPEDCSLPHRSRKCRVVHHSKLGRPLSQLGHSRGLDRTLAVTGLPLTADMRTNARFLR